MGVTTFQDILTSSLRALGVLYQGETPSAAKLAGAQDAMNLLLDEQSDVIMYASVSEDLTLIASQAAYTIGASASADFNTTRPTRLLDQCYVRDVTSGVDYPISVIGENEYNAISLKDTESLPRSVVYDPQYPLGILTFYYVPQKAYTFHCVSQKPIAEITSLTTTISLPPEHRSYLKWNVAKVLGADYPGAAAQPNFALVMAMAKRSQTIIMRINAANIVEEANLDCPTTNDGPVSQRGPFTAGWTG